MLKTSLPPYYLVSANNIKPFELLDDEDKDISSLLENSLSGHDSNIALESIRNNKKHSKKANKKFSFDCDDDSNDAYLLTLELLQSSSTLEEVKGCRSSLSLEEVKGCRASLSDVSNLSKTQDKKQGKKQGKTKPLEAPSLKASSCAESDEESDKRCKKSKGKPKASASAFTFHATTRSNSGKASGGKNQCFFISLLDGMQGVPNAPKSVQELRTQAIKLIDEPNNDYQDQHEEQIRDFIVKGNKKSSKNKKSSGCDSGNINGKNHAKINSLTSDFDCIEHGSSGIAIADHYGLTIHIYGLFDGDQCNDPIYTFGTGRHIVNVALFTTQGHFEYITKLERNI